MALAYPSPVPVEPGRHVVSAQKRLLAERGQAAIWYAQGRYPFSFTAAELSSHLDVTHRGASRILNKLARGGFIQRRGGTYNWLKVGLREP